MKFPILASVLILCALIAYNVHKQRNKIAEIQEAFWEREREANNTRRKPLDDLDYINIPLERLPMSSHRDNTRILEYTDTITELAGTPIVNLTGISNTDLKLKYGAPNIDLLSRYDQRYTTLAATLQKWAQELYDLGEKKDAKTVLEFAVSTGTDVSGTYRLLASIYIDEGDKQAVRNLIPTAEAVNSPLRDTILANLRSLVYK